LQRVAGRLLRDGTLASILVGNSEVLKTQIERHGKVEIIGDIAPKAETKQDQKVAKPQTKSPANPD
ncbi:MAG: hypothetical protein M3R67_04005, partial [Acidobacteriota bacterium]|nr:hypothetical protein [Acidobacteriota bacterium]